MHLTPREQEKLLIVVAADVARRRRERGLKLNYPEALALITAELMEGARDGKSVAQLMTYGATLLTREDVMEGVAEMLHEAQVEATFPDGTKLVTVHDPIGGDQRQRMKMDRVIPGEYLLEDDDILANEGREETVVMVRNTGDRPVQVGSHFHFFEVNSALELDRAAARGKRLNLPAGTAMRFEPGEQKQARLVPFAGTREMWGHRGLVNGKL